MVTLDSCSVALTHIFASHSRTSFDSDSKAGAEDYQEGERTVLRLSLRKPGNWRWALSTSVSSPAITLPVVQLFDHKGKLLVDTSRAQSRSRSNSACNRKGDCRSHDNRKDANRKDDTPGESKRRRRTRSELSGARAAVSSGSDLVRVRRDAGLPLALDMPSVLRAPKPCIAPSAPTMGSNTSRPNAKGLIGRRSHSSGSLCTADKLGRLLAPCGRHRQQRESRDSREVRYKLCGSLPNHLDTSPNDGDNNNTPSSPAVSEKVRARIGFELQDLGYASERSPDDDKLFPGYLSGSYESVALQRGSRGLGLSVCGGVDCSPDGLVRIKRLFPHQPAWQSGRLRPGDILLAVNGTQLTGLTNHEALEVLRMAPDQVLLTVARPSRPPPACSASFPAPPCRREPPSSLKILQAPDPRLILRQNSCGEKEVAITKVQGSLGFTLRKEDSSVLGHYVRALVREPALSDGRIRPGDKIVSVNGVDISTMSHEEAVLFLRQAGDTVHLKLYRDVVQTPVSALSPTDTHKTFRPKMLRKEALDLLSDLAVRKNMQTGDSSTLGRHRRAENENCPRVRTHSCSEPTEPERPQQRTCALNHSNQLSCNALHTASCGAVDIVDLVDTTRSSTSLSSLSSSCTNSVVERPRRPDYLNLNGESRPQWHLRKLTTSPGDSASPTEDHVWVDDGRSVEFASLPCEAVSSPQPNNFSYNNPVYQSAHPVTRPVLKNAAARVCNQQNISECVSDVDVNGEEGCKGLLKWKGVVFTPENDGDTSSASASEDKGDDTASQNTFEDSDGQVLTVELTRGWNARLGFSLKSDGPHSLISAIYSDSVAAKDGRLRIGDRIIMVNDESVEGMLTSDVIDLFRKIRGSIAITVWRIPEPDV